MSKLPDMVYSDRIRKTTQIKFAGLRHHANCTDGEIYDMSNLSTELYPVLSVRKARSKTVACNDKIRQIYADNGALLQVGQHAVYYNGWQIADASGDENTYFARLGDRVLLMPDKKLLNLKYPILGTVATESDLQNLPNEPERFDAMAVYASQGHFNIYVYDGETWVCNGWFDEPVETAIVSERATIKNGELYGQTATANTIQIDADYEYITDVTRLKEGDAVRISGMVTEPRNNKTAIIREIGKGENGKCELRFSDYCFYIPQDAESYDEYNIVLERSMPDVDFLFEHGNRLWGAKGKEIFACKQGDPTNWNVFDGLSTDSWYVEVQSRGELTGGISYGYPRFFKEGSLITVYGSIPSAFQTNESKLAGLQAGAQKSVAVVNGLLFWLSERGVMIYDGSDTYLQDQVFGEWELTKAIAQADATRYYLAANVDTADGTKHKAVFCYDTNRGLWTKENGYEQDIICMTNDGGTVYALVEGSRDVIALSGEGSYPFETTVESYLEFGDFTDDSPNRKTVNKLQLRLELEENARVCVYIRYDNELQPVWIETLEGAKKRSVYLPVRPRRCDHYRLILTGEGQWKLYSLSKEYCIGSELR